MTEYIIEKNIPITPTGRKGSQLRAALDAMDVGDSMLVKMSQAPYAHKVAAELKPKKFTHRAAPPMTTRIWRTK